MTKEVSELLQNIDLIRNEKVLKFLVEHGLDINTCNDRNGIYVTPLFKAIEYKHKYKNDKIIKFLVEHGADIHKENSAGETPLFIACKNRYRKIMDYFN